MHAESSGAVVRRYLEDVWGRGKLELLTDLVDPQVIDQDPMPGIPGGSEGWREWIEAVRAAIPNLKVTIQSLSVEGDAVYVRWLGQGRHLSRLQQIPPSKQDVYLTGLEIFRVPGGRIVERRGDLDLSNVIHASEHARGAGSSSRR